MLAYFTKLHTEESAKTAFPWSGLKTSFLEFEAAIIGVLTEKVKKRVNILHVLMQFIYWKVARI